MTSTLLAQLLIELYSKNNWQPVLSDDFYKAIPCAKTATIYAYNKNYFRFSYIGGKPCYSPTPKLKRLGNSQVKPKHN